MSRVARRCRSGAVFGLGLALVATCVFAVVGRESAAGAETVPAPIRGNWTVDGHGNGHGHGLSQYGARGAAIAGLSASQIIAFYYPGTALATLPPTSVRVQITDDGGATTVAVPAGQTLTLRWTGGSLSTTSANAARLRLVPSGGGLQAQYYATTWRNWGGVLPARADFASSAGYVRTYHGDGSFTDYRGTVGAVRDGAAELTVNRLPLDQYVQGVVPREMPASWQAAAVQAQAIAARSYARYAVEHHSASSYDICDGTGCQVYGGLARYDASGHRLYGEDPRSNQAVAATANRVATYRGATIFAQFSASDGGVMSAGGQPYLVSKPDPYDNAASGDPYLNWTRSASPARVAAHYGLARVVRIQITGRAGGGQWGGVVTTAVVTGTDSTGRVRDVSTTGVGLSNALDVPYQYFDIRAPVVDTRGGTVVSPTPTSVDFFFRTPSNTMQGRLYVTGTGWLPTVDLGAPPDGLTWDPDAATWGDGHIDLTARDGRGHLVIRVYVPGSGWTGWRVYPNVTMLSSPAAVSPAKNMLYVFYRGPSDSLWMVDWTAGAGWSQPTRVPGVNNAASGPDAGGWVQGTRRHMDVVYRGSDNRIWDVSYDTARGGWLPTHLASPGSAPPVAARAVDPSVDADVPGLVGVYSTGVDGVVYHSSYTEASHAWSRWWAIPGAAQATSAPDVADHGASHVDVLAGSDGQLLRTSWTAGPRSWSGWVAWP